MIQLQKIHYEDRIVQMCVAIQLQTGRYVGLESVSKWKLSAQFTHKHTHTNWM